MKINELLHEGIINWTRTSAQKIFDWVGKIIKRIGFGQQVEINLATAMGLNSLRESTESTTPVNQSNSLPPDPKTKPPKPKATRDKFDLTAMIGYFNEFSVAWKLAYAFEHNGVNINPSIEGGLKRHAENYKNLILDNAEKFKKPSSVIQSELQRAEDGSEIMAKKLWDEIISSHDLKLIDVDIVLTGISSMGAGKEDILIKIKKKGTEETQDMIKASLKLYKNSGGVNVYNSTFASYLVTVLTGKNDPGTGKKAVKSFLKDHPEYTQEVEEVLAITDQWLVIKNDLKKKNDPNYRKTANEFVTANRGYQKMRDLLFGRMFNDFYGRDKAAINERILQRLGLDGADDVYLLVGTERQRMIPVSSRTSKEFGQLYQQLKSGFNIRYDIPDSPDIVSCNLIIESEEGEQLVKINVGFKEGGTFPHMWDVGDIVRAAKREQGIK